MAIKKSEIYSTLWNGCDELRGAMDASQYKDYVLVILFVKYISDKAEKDKFMIVPVPEDCRFEDFVALKGKDNIGEEVNKKLAKLGRVFMLEGVLNNADFNDTNRLGKGKNLVDRVSKLIGVFENSNLDFGNNHAGDDDLIGDAYEYLMRNFAQQGGKSKGQFYTPAEVSRLMAKLIGIGDLPQEHANVSIYDPTCGSGSLLLRAKDEAKCEVSLNGQEMDLATIGMAKMNMILHNVWGADLQHDDVLNAPQNRQSDTLLQQFDYVVANPPFSVKSWLQDGCQDDAFGRWSAALLPPKGCGDYAFILHIVASLKVGGTAAVVMPHGVLFRGGMEAKIRKDIVDKHYVKGIIGLPANLFYGTGIPACLLVLHKPTLSETYEGIFMIDAKECGMKDGSKQRLRERDIRRITNVWCSQSEEPYFSHTATWEEVTEKNDYNLNLPRYVTPRDTEAQQDIYAHLHGGIPVADVDLLSDLWEQAPTLRKTLFADAGNGYCALIPSVETLHAAMQDEPSMQKQNSRFTACIENWVNGVHDILYRFNSDSDVKLLIEILGEQLLTAGELEENIVDKYSLYECLMNYWNGDLTAGANMQDDCYLVASQGWKAELREPNKRSYRWQEMECDLLPVTVVATCYAEDTLQEITEVEKAIADLQREIDEVAASEANDRETSAFPEEIFSGTPKLADVKKAISDAANRKIAYTPDQLALWKKIVSLSNKQAIQKKVLNEYNQEMIDQLKAKYNDLTPEVTRGLVIEHKWLETLKNAFLEEQHKAIQDYEKQIKIVVDRYAESLESLLHAADGERLEVNNVLREMGFNF